MKIFISYAHEDYNIANRLRLHLIQDNQEVFLDTSRLDKSASYGNVIRENLLQSDLLIFLISPYSVDKESYTLSELGIYESHYPNPSGRVLPVLIADTEAKLIPDYLSAVTYLAPKGNLVADVTAEVYKIARRNKKRKLRSFIIKSVILVFLICIFFYVYNIKSVHASNKSVYASDGEKTAFNEWVVVTEKFGNKNDAQIRCDSLKTFFKEAGQYRSKEDIFVVRSHLKKGQWLLIIDAGTGKSSPNIIRPYMDRIIDSVSRQGFYLKNRLGREIKNYDVQFYDSLEYIKLYGKIENPGKI